MTGREVDPEVGMQSAQFAPPEGTADGAPQPEAVPSGQGDSDDQGDSDVGWGQAADRDVDPHERWLLEQRPPHWD